MESYKLHVPVFEFLTRKPDVNVSGLFEEAADDPQDLIQDEFADLQRAHTRLCKRVTFLQAQNKELEAYASTIAHDLKDPLYAILLISNLINTTPDLTPVKLMNHLQKITSTANQMSQIISSLLLFAKISNTEALLEPVNMDWAVANVLDRLSDTIQEHRAQITMPESWPAAIGYTPWIEEVWANYLTNAIKYGGSSPHAELGASLQSDGMIRFWIRDHGEGLSAYDQAQLFKPLTKIKPASHSGHGLGLSIVHRIVKKLGGQVGCESDLGEGSLFYFTLPAHLLAS